MSAAIKQKDSKPEPIAYSDAALRNNAAVVEYCRTSMAALSGSTAGVLGLTGLYGFAFYVFAVVILWMMFMIRSGANWHKYYISRQSLLTNGFFGALFTYVLFWTFIYGVDVDIAHVTIHCESVEVQRTSTIGKLGSLQEARGDIGALLAFWKEIGWSLKVIGIG